MKILKKMASILIGDKPYDGVSSLRVSRSGIFVNGDLVGRHDGNQQNIKVEITVTSGQLEDVTVENGSLTCNGNIGGDVDAGGSVTCGDVSGDVDAGGSVNCGNVEGDVDAGGSVAAQSVRGGIDAGGSVSIQG